MEARERESMGIFPFHWNEESSLPPVEIARFISKFGNAETLLVIVCPDGCYDILRNGKSVALHPWQAGDLADCLETLSRLTGSDFPISDR